jgi:hypothetical protein
LNAAATDVLLATFDAALVGQADGLQMIELRHTGSQARGPDGAMTTVPAPFLLHAVGAATDDPARGHLDDVLRAVEEAARAADIGKSAPAFREGQPDAEDSLTSTDRDRLLAVREALDPDHVLAFQRNPLS